jgi:cobalt-zinc-cadmium efflux system outer membrane protein
MNVALAVSLLTILSFFPLQAEPVDAESLPFDNTILNLDDAVYRALAKSPSLDIAHHESQSKRFEVVQASLAPNPDFNYEVENIAGNRDWKGWRNREERIFASQLIETANKRQLRTKAASYQYFAALVGYKVSKLVLLNRVSRAFINVVASQELLKIAEDQAEIAHEVLRIATKKVEAGKVALIQQNKAEVAYSTALIEINRARNELKNAKTRLGLLWANPCADFDRAEFPFYEVSLPISLEQCLADLCNQPEVVQSLYNYSSAYENWKLEKAKRIPDVTFSVGYKRDGDKSDGEKTKKGLMGGISIPIPIFDQNQGNVGRAHYDMLKTGDQGRQLWLVLESKLSISYADLLRAYEEAERTKNASLPSATQAFELAQKGYREGKFEYLDVLDAQRTLFEVREKYIQALVVYHHRQADINYLNSQMD